jgi:hypothetical protein
MPSATDSVARVEGLSQEEFYRDFVTKCRPVVIQGLASGWRALEWGADSFRGPQFAAPLPVKRGDIAAGRRENVPLTDYAESLEAYEARVRAGERPDSPGYMHDVPLFQVFPSLRDDVAPFPLHLLPKWYWRSWSAYAQYFMGPTGSVTPLHFDTLLTHNLFFHLTGRKRFILIPAEQRALCYPYRWRWARFDPSAPDYDVFPRAADATPVSVVLEPGEILYMPPGTLHHVTNLSPSMSFNIDWHTADSALRGVASVGRGAPLMNGYYNLLCFLGVGLHVPAKYVLPLYRSYLSYVS